MADGDTQTPSGSETERIKRNVAELLQELWVAGTRMQLRFRLSVLGAVATMLLIARSPTTVGSSGAIRSRRRFAWRTSRRCSD